MLQQFWRNLVGQPPNINNYDNYGQLFEYVFLCIVALITLCLLVRLVVYLINSLIK